jgi:methyl-accepting chemotaxis protein
MNEERARRITEYVGGVIAQLNNMPDIVEIVERSGRLDVIARVVEAIAERAVACYDDNITQAEAVDHIAGEVLAAARQAAEIACLLERITNELSKILDDAQILENMPVQSTRH